MTTKDLSLESLRAAVARDAAIRVVTRLAPAGGPGDKVFPPTYAGGAYATEQRRVGDEVVETVLLDSVQSQANRMELALRAAYERGELRFPLVVADFTPHFPHIGRITALDAPHRIADAIFRESRANDTPFRDTREGHAFADARPANATALLELCPTALVFGVWDSTGPRGGLGAKFQRALVSEIVGFHAVSGVRTASRVDPLPIVREVTIYEGETTAWTTNEETARKDDKGNAVRRKTGRPSEINLGNVTPDVVRDDRGNLMPGGVTISHALQTSVISLPALRRLRFPVDGRTNGELDGAGRALLAALAVAAVAYQRDEGYDLRSRCLLVPEETRFELVPGDGSAPQPLEVDQTSARDLYADAVASAREAGLPWRDEEIVLEPSPELLELIRKSEQVAPELPPEEAV